MERRLLTICVAHLMLIWAMQFAPGWSLAAWYHIAIHTQNTPLAPNTTGSWIKSMNTPPHSAHLAWRGQHYYVKGCSMNCVVWKADKLLWEACQSLCSSWKAPSTIIFWNSQSIQLMFDLTGLNTRTLKGSIVSYKFLQLDTFSIRKVRFILSLTKKLAKTLSVN